MAKAAKKPKPSKAPTWPRLSSKATAELCGFTAHRLRQLEREGWFGKADRNKYDPIEVLKGYVKFLQDDGRRTSKSASASRAQEARAREIEMRIAREENRLIPIDDVQAGVTELVGAFRAALAGVAAASTRDLAIREVIEGHLNAAIERCRSGLEKMGDDLRAGREVLVDGEEAIS